MNNRLFCSRKLEMIYNFLKPLSRIIESLVRFRLCFSRFCLVGFFLFLIGSHNLNANAQSAHPCEGCPPGHSCFPWVAVFGPVYDGGGNSLVIDNDEVEFLAYTLCFFFNGQTTTISLKCFRGRFDPDPNHLGGILFDYLNTNECEDFSGTYYQFLLDNDFDSATINSVEQSICAQMTIAGDDEDNDGILDMCDPDHNGNGIDDCVDMCYWWIEDCPDMSDCPPLPPSLAHYPYGFDCQTDCFRDDQAVDLWWACDIDYNQQSGFCPNTGGDRWGRAIACENSLRLRNVPDGAEVRLETLAGVPISSSPFPFIYHSGGQSYDHVIKADLAIPSPVVVVIDPAPVVGDEEPADGYDDDVVIAIWTEWAPLFIDFSNPDSGENPPDPPNPHDPPNPVPTPDPPSVPHGLEEANYWLKQILYSSEAQRGETWIYAQNAAQQLHELTVWQTERLNAGLDRIDTNVGGKLDVSNVKLSAIANNTAGVADAVEGLEGDLSSINSNIEGLSTFFHSAGSIPLNDLNYGSLPVETNGNLNLVAMQGDFYDSTIQFQDMLFASIDFMASPADTIPSFYVPVDQVPALSSVGPQYIDFADPHLNGMAVTFRSLFKALMYIIFIITLFYIVLNLYRKG